MGVGIEQVEARQVWIDVDHLHVGHIAEGLFQDQARRVDGGRVDTADLHAQAVRPGRKYDGPQVQHGLVDAVSQGQAVA